MNGQMVLGLIIAASGILGVLYVIHMMVKDVAKANEENYGISLLRVLGFLVVVLTFTSSGTSCFGGRRSPKPHYRKGTVVHGTTTHYRRGTWVDGKK